MERISVLEAGHFVVGIDTGIIKRTASIEDYTENKNSLLHLESFFKKETCDSYRPNSTVLTMEREAGLPDLLVDRIVAEVDYPARLEPLPHLYPELAGRCCPEIFIYDNQPVILLDASGLCLVRDQLSTDIGSVFSVAGKFSVREKGEDFQQQKETFVEDVALPAERSAAKNLCQNSEEVTEASVSSAAFLQAPEESQEGLNVVSDPVNGSNSDDNELFKSTGEFEKAAVGSPPADGSVESHPRQEFTDKEFAGCVFWIIESYLGRDKPANPELTASDLPADLFTAGQTVSEQTVQEIISKTIRKCETTSDEELKEILRGMEA